MTIATLGTVTVSAPISTTATLGTVTVSVSGATTTATLGTVTVLSSAWLVKLSGVWTPASVWRKISGTWQAQ